MKLLYILGLLSLLLVSCETRYRIKDISKFRMDATALADGEPIKLLYTSQAPDHNEDLSYYIHVIVVSQKTGDTVNVLTTADNGFTLRDKDNVFNFFSQDNFVTKIIQMDSEKLKDVKHIGDIDAFQLKKINKVVGDPAFDYLEDNNYPTVIGTIGTMTNGKMKIN